MKFENIDTLMLSDSRPVKTLRHLRYLFDSNDYSTVIELAEELCAQGIFDTEEEFEMTMLASDAKDILRMRDREGLPLVEYASEDDNQIVRKIFSLIRRSYPNSKLASNFRWKDVGEEIRPMKVYGAPCLEFFVYELLGLYINDYKTLLLLRDILSLQMLYNEGRIDRKVFRGKQKEICDDICLNIILSLMDKKDLIEYDGNHHEFWLYELGKMFLWLLEHLNLEEFKCSNSGQI